MTNKINIEPNRNLKPEVTVDYLHQSTAHNPRESVQVAEIFKLRTDRQVGWWIDRSGRVGRFTVSPSKSTTSSPPTSAPIFLSRLSFMQGHTHLQLCFDLRWGSNVVSSTTPLLYLSLVEVFQIIATPELWGIRQPITTKLTNWGIHPLNGVSLWRTAPNRHVRFEINNIDLRPTLKAFSSWASLTICPHILYLHHVCKVSIHKAGHHPCSACHVK